MQQLRDQKFYNQKQKGNKRSSETDDLYVEETFEFGESESLLVLKQIP